MKIDIQKERKSFEAWHYEQYLLENPNIDISNARYIYDYAHKNALVCQLKESHFTAWQAAKAQAVPECKWSKNQGGFYDTSCTNAFVFPESDDTPEYHEFTHCPFCGGKLSEAQEAT